MSTPRVGSSRISTFGPISSQRESSTFCWLPPERLPTLTSGLAARTRSALNAASARRLAARPPPPPPQRVDPRPPPPLGGAEVQHPAPQRVAVDHPDVDVVAARHVE